MQLTERDTGGITRDPENDESLKLNKNRNTVSL